MKTEQQILLVAQKDAGDDNPGENNIFNVGVIANVLQVLKLPDGAVKILIEGKHRVKVSKFLNTNKLKIVHVLYDFPLAIDFLPEESKDNFIIFHLLIYA